MLEKLHLIYFSPTGSTKKIVESIAEGMGVQTLEQIDLTLPTKSKSSRQLTDGAAIIGVPVYAGRVPVTAMERLKQYSATGIPTVLVAVYGNRAWEDTLVELADSSDALGFTLFAAAAFIGEHSYSTSSRPIAGNRPNKEDLVLARKFGDLAIRRIRNGTALDHHLLPGNRPYREAVSFGGIAPETDQAACVLCGICVAHCPQAIIRITTAVQTEATDCIMCCACVKGCPQHARELKHPVIQERRDILYQQFSRPQQPACFPALNE